MTHSSALNGRCTEAEAAPGPAHECDVTPANAWRPSSELEATRACQQLPLLSLCGGVLAPYSVGGELDWGDDAGGQQAGVEQDTGGVWRA